MKNFALAGLAALALVFTAPHALGATKKKAPKSPEAAAPAAPQPPLFTNYYCTIRHEVSFDSSAAPQMNPVGHMPIPHMGKVAIYKETGTRLPRPRDMWEEDAKLHSMENPQEYHDHGRHEWDSASVATPGMYVLHWIDPGKGGPEHYEFLTIREDHPGDYKPFYAGMGGNLYIGVCEQ